METTNNNSQIQSNQTLIKPNHHRKRSLSVNGINGLVNLVSTRDSLKITETSVVAPIEGITTAFSQRSSFKLSAEENVPVLQPLSSEENKTIASANPILGPSSTAQNSSADEPTE